MHTHARTRTCTNTHSHREKERQGGMREVGKVAERVQEKIRVR